MKNNVLYKSSDGMIEICEMSEEKMGGRVKIKMIAHEIYEDKTLYNENGITWLEEYVKDNLETTIGMPYVVDWAFAKEDGVPSGHGKMSYNEDGEVEFTGETVGSVQESYIADVVIKGVKKKVLMTEGYLYEQRNRPLIEFLRSQKEQGNTIYGSIEINGRNGDKNIKYLNGNKNEDGTIKMGRIPTVYSYSGLAILYIEPPADSISQIVEINTPLIKNNIATNSNKEENKNMDEKIVLELNQKIEDKTNEINTLNKTIETKQVEVNGLNEKVTELNEALVNANKMMEETNGKMKAIEEELNACKEELNKYKEQEELTKIEKAKAEVNSYFENEIIKNGFEDLEINTLKEYVEKNDLEGLKRAEAELCAKKFKEIISRQQETEVNTKSEMFISIKEKEIKEIKGTIPTFFN